MEFSLPPSVANLEDDDDLEVAWLDGCTWKVPAWSVGRFRKFAQKGTKASGSGILWKGEQKDSHHSLHLAQRCDRCLLLSLYEQGRQVAQIKVGDFGPLPLPQPGVVDKANKTLGLALAFMQPIAVMYEGGEFDDAKAMKAHIHAQLHRRAELPGHVGSSAPSVVNKKPARAQRTVEDDAVAPKSVIETQEECSDASELELAPTMIEAMGQSLTEEVSDMLFN